MTVKSRSGSASRTRSPSPTRTVARGDALVDRRVDLGAGLRGERRGAADVVRMMMRQQDRAQAQALAGQRGVHGRGFAGIDHHGRTRRVGEQPDVVVGERGEGDQTHGRREYSQRGGVGG